ncbi:MAG: tRNA dihydrouridine synthase DusB [Lachnospiraceae bacterium]
MNSKFYIGNLGIPGRLVLGPMAGVTDSAYRNICKSMGCSLLYTEMVSAKGLYYKSKNTEELLTVTPDEHPLALQLFGSEPELMGEMAAKVKDRPFDIIDVNMGCPVPKVVGNGEGSYLMNNPVLVGRIVEELVKKAGKPVTVKIRKGFEQENAVEIARVAQESGASAVAVHGRLRSEYYSGKADWECIRKVKEALHIPVIGSGDVTTPEECKAMLMETGCDAVMIARAARGNPWIFRDCKSYLETGRYPSRPNIEEVKQMVLRHAGHMVEQKGEWIAMNEMRKHVAWYFQGYPHSAKLRASVGNIKSMGDLTGLLKQYEV